MSVERPHEDRLGTGGASTTEVLTRTGTGTADWKEPAFVNPMTTAADLIVGGTAGAPARLAKGSDGQVLTVSPSTHLLVWATPSGGSGSVATDTIFDAKGDLAVGTGSDTAAKLTVGANDTIPMADSAATTGIKWVASQTPTTQAFSDAAAQGTADTYARGDHLHGMPASPGGGGALVLLEQHTASASASLNFTTFISSTYDEYVIEGVAVAPATNGVNLLIQAGTGGGPTWDTGNNYDYMLNARSSANGALDAGASGVSCILFTALSNDAGYGFGSFSLRFTEPLSTVHRRVFWGTIQQANSTPANVGGAWAASYDQIGTALTGLRFIMSSGNIASGTIRIYGLVK